MRGRRRTTAGFTLVEMVTSLVILAVLLAACGSILSMAARTVGDGTVRTQSQLQTADAAAQLTDDLNVALNFTERTSTAITFTVPDRLGSGVPQAVRYAWSGTAGDPLTRQFNGGAVATLLPAVQVLNAAYTTRLAGAASPAVAKKVISYHDTLVGSLQNFNLNSTTWGSQYFMPSLPLLTNSYTITSVRLLLKAGAQGDALNVSIRTSDLLQKPTNTILAQTTVYQSALSNSFEWVDVPISGLSGLSPLTGLCLELKNETGSNNVGQWQTDKLSSSTSTSQYWTSTSNSGSTWATGSNTTVARFYIYGTVP